MEKMTEGRGGGGEKPAGQVHCKSTPPPPPPLAQDGSATASCLQPDVNRAVVKQMKTEDLSLFKFSSYVFRVLIYLLVVLKKKTNKQKQILLRQVSQFV